MRRRVGDGLKHEFALGTAGGNVAHGWHRNPEVRTRTPLVGDAGCGHRVSERGLSHTPPLEIAPLK
jgi:hypothetical protein